jgi:hypothetical protein
MKFLNPLIKTFNESRILLDGKENAYEAIERTNILNYSLRIIVTV